MKCFLRSFVHFSSGISFFADVLEILYTFCIKILFELSHFLLCFLTLKILLMKRSSYFQCNLSICLILYIYIIFEKIKVTISKFWRYSFMLEFCDILDRYIIHMGLIFGCDIRFTFHGMFLSYLLTPFIKKTSLLHWIMMSLFRKPSIFIVQITSEMYLKETVSIINIVSHI